MQVGILKTDGGPHAPEAWAVATAGMLVVIDDKVQGARLLQAQRLQVAVADALVPHHSNVMDGERGKLTAKGAAHYEVPFGSDADVDAAVASIQTAAANTPWADHFQEPEVITGMKALLHNHFSTVQDVERSWHKYRAAASPVAAAPLVDDVSLVEVQDIMHPWDKDDLTTASPGA
jgi:hypothetical protein